MYLKLGIEHPLAYVFGMCRLLLKAFSSFLIGACFISSAHAALELQSLSIMLKESSKYTTFSIKNPGKLPVLLVTRLADVSDQAPLADQILISPPIIRLEPGASQIVRFDLVSTQPLDHEYLLKATFDGVEQTKSGSKATLAIAQTIAMLVTPSAIDTQDVKPWEALAWSLNNGQVVIHNPSKLVVRWVPNFELLPSGQKFGAPNMYLLPGETLSIPVEAKASKDTQLQFAPMSRSGVALPSVSLPIHKNNQ